MVVDRTVAPRTAGVTAWTTTELDNARAIYDHVLATMRYDKTTPGWGRGDTLRACQLGAGNCTDFHSLLISMSRAAGVPARFAIGATVPLELGVIPSALGGTCSWRRRRPARR